MLRAAPSPSPVRDTPQTSAHVLQFFGRGWMGLEKAGISQMGQCLKDHQSQRNSVPSHSHTIFLAAFPW